MYRYTAGKQDWFASGLPIAGELVRELRILDAARRDLPTCSVTERVGDVWQRVQAADWNECVVVNPECVVLGRVRGDAWKNSPETQIEQVMECAPQTYRPHELVSELTERMREKEVESVLVTTSDGELLGVFYRMPHGAPSNNGQSKLESKNARPERQTKP